jgi:hypothetical protein
MDWVYRNVPGVKVPTRALTCKVMWSPADPGAPAYAPDAQGPGRRW